MNLKEAFRFQNKLRSMMDEVDAILGVNSNITKVQNTCLRHKVMAEAEDETTVDTPPTEYGDKITELAEFLLHLLTEREKLSAAIHKAKSGLELTAGLDGEVSLNGKRQDVASPIRHPTNSHLHILLDSARISKNFIGVFGRTPRWCIAPKSLDGRAVYLSKNGLSNLGLLPHPRQLEQQPNKMRRAAGSGLLLTNNQIQFWRSRDQDLLHRYFKQRPESVQVINGRQTLSLLPLVDGLRLFKSKVGLEVTDG